MREGRCHGFDNKLRAALNSSTVHCDRVDSTHNTRRFEEGGCRAFCA
jgi:hypothetical protein